MRIHLTTTPNTSPVGFNYQQKLVGTIHKWLGQNTIHDEISLYSFSWLNGGKLINNSLSFPEGASMFISFHDSDIAKTIARSIIRDPDMFCGMKVTSITIQEGPTNLNREVFACASPIFIKRKIADGTEKHFTFNDPEAATLLKETLLSKMKKAGMEDHTFEICFDTSYPKKKLKLVRYRNIGNKANICPIIIKGKPEAKLFAWNVGVGNNTGIGFGAIY